MSSEMAFVIVRGREASVTVVAEEPVRVGTSPFSSIYNGDRGHPPDDLGGCGTLGVHGSALLGWDTLGQLSTRNPWIIMNVRDVELLNASITVIVSLSFIVAGCAVNLVLGQ